MKCSIHLSRRPSIIKICTCHLHFISNSEGQGLWNPIWIFFTLHTMTVWGHIVFWFVCPDSLCECNSSFNDFCRSYGTLTSSCIFNIAILCERNSSEVVGSIAFIYDKMIGDMCS